MAVRRIYNQSATNKQVEVLKIALEYGYVSVDEYREGRDDKAIATELIGRVVRDWAEWERLQGIRLLEHEMNILLGRN